MTALLALLNAIPALGGIVSSITAAFFNAKVQIVQARTGADRDTAVALVKGAGVEAHERTAALGIIAGNSMLTLLVVAFAGPLVIYIWKVVVWDIVLGLGTTDPIRGQVADWANTIIWSIFGSTGVAALGKMYFARKTD